MLWEVRDEEEGQRGNDNGRNAFQDEYPSPVLEASNTVHVRDRAGQESAEGPCCQNRAPEYGESLLGLVPLIPETYEVET